MLKIYADRLYTRYLQRRVKRQYKVKNIKMDVVPHGIIVNAQNHGFGVFDNKYKFVKSSSQAHKGRKGQFVPKFSHDNIPYVDTDVVFLGNMELNFGHFLLEQMNRAWFALDKKYNGIKVALVNEKSKDKIPEYMYVLLELLGVKRDDVLVVNTTTQFRTVYVPHLSFDLPLYYSDEFGAVYNKIANNVSDPDVVYDKVYVSRCAMSDDRRTWGEEQVQNIFAKNGYKIIYPETLPLVQQISLVKNCKILAGCGGTALHLALFMKKGGQVIQIKRNLIQEDNADVQQLINKTKGLDGIFVAGSVEVVKTEHWSVLPQLIAVTPDMIRFFDDNKFKYTQHDIAPDIKAKEQYLNQLSKHVIKSSFATKLKKGFIHYSSCFVPGRERRAHFRTWLAKVLKYK